MSDHYFTAQPVSANRRHTIPVKLAGRSIEVDMAPGVFSADRIDKGTATLLQLAPPPPQSGPFLDLGCGWGPIALTLALERPSERVWAVDVNERALDLLAGTASRLDLNNLTPALPTDVPTDVEFSLIWSNPPIRIGKSAVHSLLQSWLPRLAPGGSAWLVVAKNLGADSLQRWLADHLGDKLTVSRPATKGGFRLLEIRRDAG